MSASDPSPNSQDAPKGELALRTLAMPADTNPIYVGDVVCCYTDIVHVGKTSIQVLVSAWVLRGRRPENRIKVTEGTFSFVAIDTEGKKRDVPPLDNL